MLHQVGNLFEINVKLRCQKVKYYESVSVDLVMQQTNACAMLYCHVASSAVLYSVIQKDGLNFASLYFRIRTSDKYDVNYI